MLPEWRILYEDDASFDSTQGTPEDAPPWGVLAIWMPGGRSLYNKDYYIWRQDYQTWIEVDLVGLIDHLIHHAKDIHAVKVGRVVPWKKYKGVLDVIREARPDG